jgi:hypothetical protein
LTEGFGFKDQPSDVPTLGSIVQQVEELSQAGTTIEVKVVQHVEELSQAARLSRGGSSE